MSGCVYVCTEGYCICCYLSKLFVTTRIRAFFVVVVGCYVLYGPFCLFSLKLCSFSVFRRSILQNVFAGS